MDEDRFEAECRELWRNVYVVSLRRGSDRDLAEQAASAAVEKYKERFHIK